MPTDCYHRVRPHRSLSHDSPIPRPVEPHDCGNIIEMPKVGGLHHQYLRQAAWVSANNSIKVRHAQRNHVQLLRKSSSTAISLSRRNLHRVIVANFRSNSRPRKAAFPLRRTFCHPHRRRRLPILVRQYWPHFLEWGHELGGDYLTDYVVTDRGGAFLALECSRAGREGVGPIHRPPCTRRSW